MNIELLPAKWRAKITVNGDGCWVWGGAITTKGYGGVSINRRPYLAHRVVYEHLVGPIPDGHHLDHLCRNRPCVNPGHLEAVTPAENNRRAPEWGGNKTHCPQGHEYPPGRRTCLICRRDAQRRYRARKKVVG